VESLYFAQGLLDNDQGESVVALRKTSKSSVRKRSEPNLVSAPKTSLSLSARGSSSYLYFRRCQDIGFDEHLRAGSFVERQTGNPIARPAAMIAPVLVPAI
jgi:hypothetical protein